MAANGGRFSGKSVGQILSILSFYEGILGRPIYLPKTICEELRGLGIHAGYLESSDLPI